MAENNRKWVLKSRPRGMVDRANFEWRDCQLFVTVVIMG